MRHSLLITLIAGLAASEALAQSISSVEPASPTRSRRVVIRGSGFGAGPGSVLIGGVPAHIANWSDTRIAAYPAESTPLGAAEVRVVSTAQSNAVPVTVQARPAPSGRIRWRFDGDAYYFHTRPAIAPDGAILAPDAFGHLYCIEADGALRWIRPGVSGSKSASIASDGTIYITGLGAMVAALNPADGSTRWAVPYPSNAGQLCAGPNVGPDGKIYFVTDESQTSGLDFGAAAITPQGQIAWNRSGNFGVRVGSFGYAWEVTPGGDAVYIPSGQGAPIDNVIGMFALSASSGSIRWSVNSIMWPRFGADGNVYIRNLDGNNFASITPSGSERWRTPHTSLGGTPTGDIALDSSSNFYTTSGLNIASGNSQGQQRWRTSLTETTTQHINVRPDGSLAVLQCSPFSVSISKSIRGFDGATGQQRWSVDLGFDQGVRINQMWNSGRSPDGRYWYIPCSGSNGAPDPIAPLFAIDSGEYSACYANCDNSTASPVLTANDFSCFLNRFAASDPASDCDATGGLTANDFACFLARFAAGCS